MISYETYALVRDLVRARPLPPIHMKESPARSCPMRWRGCSAESERAAPVFSEHATGLDLFLDVNAMDDGSAERVRGVLRDAIAALDERSAAPELGDRARHLRRAEQRSGFIPIANSAASRLRTRRECGTRG